MKNMQKTSGMTLMEILLVMTLFGMVSLAIYNALNNGIKIFQRNEQLVIEEDIILFMDKLSQDARNAVLFSKLPFKGDAFKVSFPTVVLTEADRRSASREKVLVEQLGRVEYFYDVNEDAIFRRQANYSQALNERFGQARKLVEKVDRLTFRYFYYAENEEIYSPEVLDMIPSGMEVEIEFSDQRGSRALKKFITLPIGS